MRRSVFCARPDRVLSPEILSCIRRFRNATRYCTYDFYALLV